MKNATLIPWIAIGIAMTTIAHTGWAMGGGRVDAVGEVQQLKELAEQGDFYAQYYLGLMYGSGVGVKQDKDEAKRWNPRAAEQGIALAQKSLETMYADGTGVTQNYQGVMPWNPEAAGRGIASVPNNLGRMYGNGDGFTQNNQGVTAWNPEATERGFEFPSAPNNLGRMYGNGDGVTQNNQGVTAWNPEAAEQGIASVPNNFGLMYDNSDGVMQGNQGSMGMKPEATGREFELPSALATRGWIQGNGEGVTQDDGKFLRFVEELARLGVAEAQTLLGFMYMLGVGVKQSYDEATRWCQIAKAQNEEQNNATASVCLALISSGMAASLRAEVMLWIEVARVVYAIARTAFSGVVITR